MPLGQEVAPLRRPHPEDRPGCRAGPAQETRLARHDASGARRWGLVPYKRREGGTDGGLSPASRCASLSRSISRHLARATPCASAHAISAISALTSNSRNRATASSSAVPSENPSSLT
eukprot:scaffold6637_cov56-Isochrysis_galbana.AAC.1